MSPADRIRHSSGRREPALRATPAWEVPSARPLPWIEALPPESGGVRDLANRFLEHGKLAAAVFVVVLLGGLAYWLFATPVYRVEALLQMDEKAPFAPVALMTRQQNALQGSLESPYFPVSGEMEILRSRELLTNAISASHADIDIRVDNRFPLIGDWYARRYAKSGAAGVAPAPFGLGGFAWGGESLDLATFEIPPYLYGEPFYVERYGDGWVMFDSARRFAFSGPFGRDVDVDFAGHPGVIRINGISGGPKTRFRVERNDRAAVYAQLLRDLRIVEPAREAGVVRVSLDTAHPPSTIALMSALVRGYLERGVQVRSGEAERSLAFLEQQLPTVKSDLERAEDALSDYRSRTQSVNLDQQSQSAFAQVLQLEKSKVELEMKRSELAQKFGPEHPQMVTVRQQLDAINRQLARLNGGFSTLPRNARDLVRLQREVNTSGALYTSMLNSIQELRIARAGMVGNARVVDPPRPSARPVRPRAIVVLPAAAGIGVTLGFGAILLAGFLRPTIRDADEIEAGVGLATAVTIPESARQRSLPRARLPLGRPRPRLLSIDAPDEAAVESLRSFRMRLTRGAAGPVTRHVLITSATSGAGKTFVAANLAALLAVAGRRVLLIEADLRHPKLHQYFDAPRAQGLAEVLSGTAAFDLVARTEVLPRVDLLLAGKPDDNPADLLSSASLRALLDRVGAQYDHVVFDSAPILPAGDGLAIAQLPVATYLVARAEHTTLHELQEAARRLDGVGADVRGVIFNGAKRMRIDSLPYYYVYRARGGA